MTKSKVKIYYRDTDCGGVVYYGRDLEYFEIGRTRYMEERGVDIAAEAAGGTLFAVRSASVKYISPALYGDTLTIDTVLESVRGARINFTYRVTREDGGEIAEGETLLACIDPDMRPRRVPERIIERLSAGRD